MDLNWLNLHAQITYDMSEVLQLHTNIDETSCGMRPTFSPTRVMRDSSFCSADSGSLLRGPGSLYRPRL